MICPRCGTQNDDQRAACWSCFAQLRPIAGVKPVKAEKPAKAEKPVKPAKEPKIKKAKAVNGAAVEVAPVVAEPIADAPIEIASVASEIKPMEMPAAPVIDLAAAPVEEPYVVPGLAEDPHALAEDIPDNDDFDFGTAFDLDSDEPGKKDIKDKA